MSVEPRDPLWLALSHLPGTLWLLPVLCIDLIMAPLLFPGSTAMPATPSLTMTSRPRRSCSSVMVGTSNSAVHLDWECTLTCSLVNSYSSFKTQFKYPFSVKCHPEYFPGAVSTFHSALLDSAHASPTTLSLSCSHICLPSSLSSRLVGAPECREQVLGSQWGLHIAERHRPQTPVWALNSAFRFSRVQTWGGALWLGFLKALCTLGAKPHGGYSVL